jgi:hypothetical protein
MGCGGCGQKKQRFLTNVMVAKKSTKQKEESLEGIPDDQLTPFQLRKKYRVIRAENRRKRIQYRNAKSNLIRQKNDLKNLSE